MTKKIDPAIEKQLKAVIRSKVGLLEMLIQYVKPLVEEEAGQQAKTEEHGLHKVNID